MTTSSPGRTSISPPPACGVNRQLGGESPLIGRPRFGTGDIGGEVRIFVQNARCFQPEYRDHHQVAPTDPPSEPVGTADAGGQLLQPVANAILDQRQALLAPGLVPLQK